MKKLTFTLEIKFNDDISDANQIDEIAENIKSAIDNQVQTAGLSPEDSNAFTMSFKVIYPDNLDIVKQSIFA